MLIDVSSLSGEEKAGRIMKERGREWVKGEKKKTAKEFYYLSLWRT